MSNMPRLNWKSERGRASDPRSGLNSNRMFLLRLMWEQEGIEQAYQAIFE
jgi:hypothetical protein